MDTMTEILNQLDRQDKAIGQTQVAGAMYLIETQSAPSASAASFAFSSIPQQYTHLVAKGSLRGTQGATTVNVNTLINTASVGYYSMTLYNSSATAAAAAEVLNAANFAFTISGSTAVANAFSQVELTFYDYAASVKNPSWLISSGIMAASTTTNQKFGGGEGTLNASQAITSLSFTPASGGFSQYSKLSLYGVY